MAFAKILYFLYLHGTTYISYSFGCVFFFVRYFCNNFLRLEFFGLVLVDFSNRNWFCDNFFFQILFAVICFVFTRIKICFRLVLGAVDAFESVSVY